MSKQKADTGKRYPQVKKQYILDWIKSRHKSQGHGAISAASTHFKIPFQTIYRWYKKAGGGSARPRAVTLAGRPNATTSKPIKKAFNDLLKVQKKYVTVMERIVKSLT